jgi:hypothetical protein
MERLRNLAWVLQACSYLPLFVTASVIALFVNKDMKNVPLITTSLDTTTSFKGPVAVLHGADIPPLGGSVELQLESLMVRYLILVSCYIHT